MASAGAASSSTDGSHPHARLSREIIAAAMKVHTALGPGYLEKIYENALLAELSTRGLRAQQQVSYTVSYSGKPVGQHVLDLVVEGLIYVELKCKELTGLEIAQVLSGLKASQLPVGLLINFKTEHLRDGIRRVLLPDKYRPSDGSPSTTLS